MKLPVMPRLPVVAPESQEGWARAADLKIVAIYDGLKGGIRLHEALGWLHRSLAPWFRISAHSWCFSALDRLDVRAAAVHAAADADVLIVAAEPDAGLPDATASWIERCHCENGQGPAALVALHDRDEDSSKADGLTRRLQKIASRWRMRYIGNEEMDACLDAEGVHDLIATEAAYREASHWAFALPDNPERWEFGPLDE